MKSMDINVAHSLWGHCGGAMLKRTARDQNTTLFGKLSIFLSRQQVPLDGLTMS